MRLRIVGERVPDADDLVGPMPEVSLQPAEDPFVPLWNRVYPAETVPFFEESFITCHTAPPVLRGCSGCRVKTIYFSMYFACKQDFFTMSEIKIATSFFPEKLLAMTNEDKSH